RMPQAHMTSTSRSREKLIEANLFFAKHTKYCGKLKLFKLLYLLDFRHFKETGRSVTGLEYQAWEKGPVPRDLYDEWLFPEEDFSRAVSVVEERVYDMARERVVARREPDETVFTA